MAEWQMQLEDYNRTTTIDWLTWYKHLLVIFGNNLTELQDYSKNQTLLYS